MPGIAPCGAGFQIELPNADLAGGKDQPQVIERRFGKVLKLGHSTNLSTLRAAPKYFSHSAMRRGEDHPCPLVLVFPSLARFSMNSMIIPAISLPVAFSIPSSPGEELTSMITGP